MKIFDTNVNEKKLDTGKRTTVLHQAENFKMRVIELAPEGIIPPCEMVDNVIFHVLSGSADITVNGEIATVKEGQGIVIEPATVSMKSSTGARLLGIQIEVANG